VDRDAYSVPMDLMVVQYGNFSKPDQQQRILEAHEALADLNEGNRRTFDRVVDRLREEKQPHPV